MKRQILVLAAVVLVVAVGSLADAQQGGQRGRGGFGGGFGGFGRGGGADLLGLVSIEKVQEEIEALDEQVADIGKLREELRGQGRGGQRGRRPGAGGERGNRPRGGERGQGERRPRGEGGERQRRNFADLTDEQRAEFQKQAAERAKQAAERAKVAEAKLAEILLPHQMDRLKEIQLQQQGTGALNNKDVAAKLKITPEQVAEIEKISTENRQTMMTEMRALFQGGDREGMREKLTELRKKSDDKLLAVLTGEQKTQFTALKGKAFEMPQRRGRGEGQGGGRGARPARPRRPGSGN